MTLLELLIHQVDPVTCGLMVAYWARWESWRHSHDAHHARLDELATLRAHP